MPASSVAAPLPLRFSVPSARAAAARLTTMHFGAASLVILVGGILLSVLTTTEPLWWQLHFSELGTYRDTSGSFFNGTLIIAGITVTLYARSVGRDLRRIRRVYVRRGAPLVAQICLSVVGVNLSLVGCIPLNVNKTLHDNVAGSMVLGFAALLLTSPIFLHRMPKRLLLTTSIVFVVIFIGAWLFVTETINLALFEVIATSAMFAWSGIFTRSLTARVQTVSSPGAPVGTPAATPVPRRHRAVRSHRRALRPTSRPQNRTQSLTRVPRRPQPVRPAVLRAAHAPLPRGRTASAARGASGPWTTPDRRSRRSRAVGR